MGDVVIPINYLAVFAGAVSSMIIGYFWYGPLFGKLWMKEIGTKEPDKMGEGAGKSYFIMFIGSLFMSSVMAYTLEFASTYTKTYGVTGGLMTAFWNWLGFVAPVTLGSVLWEKKSLKLWSINTFYYLVSLSVMGVILALWK